MMDKSRAQKWVDENAERLKESVGLKNWRLVVNCEPLEAKANGMIRAMTVKVAPEYERATIWINYDALEDEESLEEHFRHELFHCINAPFESVYQVIFEMLTEEQVKVVNTLWNQAEELTVRNLERLHQAYTEAAND